MKNTYSKNIINIFNKIKRYRKKLRIRKYYIEQLKEGKRYFATIIDTIVVKIIVFLLPLLYLISKTNNYILSTLISVELFLAYNIITYIVRRVRFKKIKKIIDEELVKENIRKQLINKEPNNLIEYMQSVFKKNDISNIKLSAMNNIDMIGDYKNDTIAIKCFQYNEDYKVSNRDIREFLISLSKLELKKGIVISTSSYSKEVKRFLDKIEKHIEIQLVDMDKFIKILKQAKMYPTKNEIEEYILDRIDDKRNKLNQYRKVIFSKNKIRKYILISIIIYFWGKVTPYEAYYTIVSYLLILLAFIIIIVNIVLFYKSKQEAYKGRIM